MSLAHGRADARDALYAALPECPSCHGVGEVGGQGGPICGRCGGEGVVIDLPPASSRTYAYDWPPGEGPIVPGVDQGPSRPRERIRLEEATVTEFAKELPMVSAKGSIVKKDGTRDGRRTYSAIASGVVDDVILAAHFAAKAARKVNDGWLAR